MGIGVSIFLIAVGAILAFAVEVTVSGLDLQTVGLILLIVGAIGLVASLLFWSSSGLWPPAARPVISTATPRRPSSAKVRRAPSSCWWASSPGIREDLGREA